MMYPEMKIVWKVALAGLGGSSPIVMGDQVFVTSQIGSAAVRGGAHLQLARDDPSLELVQVNRCGANGYAVSFFLEGESDCIQYFYR